jgi:tetratricopeptide (TPR) repeat protein
MRFANCIEQVLGLSIAILTICLDANAQITLPRISPAASVKQTIGLTEFVVDYSRPSRRDRELLGELIPYGIPWRMGANEATKLRVSEDVMVNGDTLRSGAYALYALPSPILWQVVFYADTTYIGDGTGDYDPKKEVLRICAEPYEQTENIETFTIDFQDLTHNAGRMVIAWGQFRVPLDFQVFTDDFVMQDIEAQIAANPNAATYYESARYLQEQSKEQEVALQYLDRAEILGGPNYFIYRIRALLLAQLKRYADAIQAAEASKLLAKDGGNDEFVRLNEKSIRDWKLIIKK